MHRAAVGRRLVAGVAVATMGASVLLVLPAGANHHYDCSRFGSQPLAQQALDEQPSEFTNLDPDGDGIACEHIPEVSEVPPDTSKPPELDIPRGDFHNAAGDRIRPPVRGPVPAPLVSAAETLGATGLGCLRQR